MPEPKVTVIVPVWKPNEEWLKECLDALKDQTYPNVGICVSELYGDSLPPYEAVQWHYVSPIIKPPHFLNIYHQINEALRQTDSKYVMLCGADDIYYPTKIEEEVKLAEEHDALAVYSDYEEWNTDLSKKFQTVNLPDRIDEKVVFARNAINDLSLIRRDFIDLQVDPLMPRYTWWWFWMRKITELLLEDKERGVEKIVHCKNVGFKYRQVEDAMHNRIKGQRSYFAKDNQVALDRLMLGYAIPLMTKLKEGGVTCQMV